MNKTLVKLKKNNCAISIIDNGEKIFLMVENKEGLSDYPHKNPFSSPYTADITYDHPGEFPKYIKSLVPFMFECLYALQFAKNHLTGGRWHGYSSDGTDKALNFLAENNLILIDEKLKMFSLKEG